MSYQNEVRLIGNIGGDVVVRVLEGGRNVGYFSLAVSTYFVNSSGERVDRTDWCRVSLYGKLLDSSKGFLVKGARVALIGELRSHSYTDKEGKSQQVFEVVPNIVWEIWKGQ